ncbi:MAG: hypothetical protein J0M17_18035 [Planctomycetes bacterium]|nr:hypothetical protein [Planctomycetota bacterium]
MAFVQHPDVKILLWNLPGVSQREKMLSGLVFAARNIRTPWYLKLDVDVLAEPCPEWLKEEWFHADRDGRTPRFVASPWSYTKPASWIPALETWGDRVPYFSNYPALGIGQNNSTTRLQHRRIISYCFFGDTAWTVKMASLCGGERLPVPSHDTFLWYCAARRRDHFRAVRMSAVGWRHLRPRKLLGESYSILQRDRVATGRVVNRSPELNNENSAGFKQSYHDCGVVYLLTGPAHGARLVTSLVSLRRHWNGPITVYTTQKESDEIARMCAMEKSLQIDHRTWQLFKSRSNASFLTKVALLPRAPYRRLVYLDCDTLVAGDIRPLFDGLLDQPICVTQFANWTTQRRNIRRRIDAWRKVRSKHFSSELLSRLIDGAKRNHPAVNGGVFAVHNDTDFNRRWLELATAGRRTFICDEIALQLLLAEQSHALLDCRFNCSPIYAGSTSDVRVWHFHGEKHVRHIAGRRIWLPAFEACRLRNLAGIADWSSRFDSQVRRLSEYASISHTQPTCPTSEISF